MTGSAFRVSLLAALLMAGSAFAQDAAHSDALLGLLNVIDEIPTQEQLVAAGAGEDGAGLRAVAADPTVGVYARIRATSALGWFPNDTNTAFLGELALDGNAEREQRIAAISALKWDERPTAIAAVDITLQTLASDPDEAIQEAVFRAARSIGQRGLPILRSVLASLHAANEFLRPEIEQALIPLGR